MKNIRKKSNYFSKTSMSITTHFSRKLNLSNKKEPEPQIVASEPKNLRKPGALIGASNPKKPKIQRKMTLEERLEKFREYELEYGENLERLYPNVKRKIY